MNKLVPVFLCLGLTACGGSNDDSNSTVTPPPLVPPSLKADVCYQMSTTMGNITLAIDLTNVPVTGNNFIDYVESDFYNGTLFHRSVNNFVVQGGGYTSGLVAKLGNAPIINEANIGLSNKRGTIAMARTSAPDSATSQFFINILDNPQLDASSSNHGYAVFGEVTSGMEVVDQISVVSTNGSDVPLTEILISSVTETNCSN